MKLSKDADKLVCALYALYQERRKNGMDKLNARHYKFSEIQTLSICSEWCADDILATIAEISRADLGDMYYGGGFMANDAFVVYMENRFKDGLNEFTDFITKFIP